MYTELEPVSVLMPVRNGGVWLAAAVDSILAQQNIQLELLLIDDDSSDDAIENLPANPLLTILRNNGHGLVDALNTGIAEARYPILARMDGDDIAHPQRLVRQSRYLQQHPEIDIAGTAVELFSDEGAIAEGYRLYQQWINNLTTPALIERDFFIESPIPHPSAMLRASTMSALGGYQDNGWPEDYDLWCRALLAGYRFGKPGVESLLRWRDYSTRTSRTDDRYSKHGFLRCKAQYLARYLQARSITSARIWGTGPTGLKLHDLLEQQNLSIEGFIDINPRMQGRQKRHKPIDVLPDQCDPKRLQVYRHKTGHIIIVAVSARGARQQIRDYLNSAQLQEGQDYILAA